MDEDDFTSDKIHKLIESAINPRAFYRRNICKRLVSQIYNQFGVDGILDILTGVDEIGRFQSVIVADRYEIDNYLYSEHGIFDADMFEKVQMTDEWDDFMNLTLEQSSIVLGAIVDSIVRKEK